MNSVINKTMLVALVASLVVLSGCSVTGFGANSSVSSAGLEKRAKELDAREAELNARAGSATVTVDAEGNAVGDVPAGNDLLPPHAQPGECYARVWVDAEYKTITEEVVAVEESQKVTVIPAQYETVSEKVEVSAASTRLETIPAVYGTETEQVLVSDVRRLWRVDLGSDAAPASDALLAAAVAHGIDLDAASPGMCFHEHYLPTTYRTENEQVLVKAATEEVSITPAQYETVEESVLIKEASTKLVEIAAEYETVEEQIIDKPAHTIWKKGAGPIQKIDDATGEIMCLVEVPATYKTVKRTVLKTPARTETVEIPAEYKTVKVTKLVSAASEQRTPVEPVYKTVDKQVVDQQGGFDWHEIHNKDHPASTRTGNKICLTEIPAQYKTIERTVVQTPAQTRTIEIPAEYKQVEVTKLVSPAREEVTTIPAEYKTIEKRELVKDGYMAWRSILCETNMTRARIADIQRALIAAGYDVGPNGVDGDIGADTLKAVNEFQRANNLPVDRYLNVETIKALGVSHR